MPLNQLYQGSLSPLIALAASFQFILVFPLIDLMASSRLVQDFVQIFLFFTIFGLFQLFPLYRWLIRLF